MEFPDSNPECHVLIQNGISKAPLKSPGNTGNNGNADGTHLCCCNKTWLEDKCFMN